MSYESFDLLTAQAEEKNGEIWQAGDDPRGECASTASITIPDYILPAFIEVANLKRHSKFALLCLRSQIGPRSNQELTL